MTALTYEYDLNHILLDNMPYQHCGIIYILSTIKDVISFISVDGISLIGLICSCIGQRSVANIVLTKVHTCKQPIAVN